jgi:putative transposase
MLAVILWVLAALAWLKWSPGFSDSYRRRGLACKPLRTHPHRQQAKPAWVRHEVIRLKALMPDSGCRTIATVFNRRHACHDNLTRRATIGKSYVADIVRHHRYDIDVMRRNIKHRVPSPMARNRVWAMDMILGLIDHGSRALLTLTALPNKTSWTLLGHVCLAIGRYGKPLAIRCDNEAVFKSRLMRIALACMGIRQQFTDPGCPWQNGRIERLFLTLKQKLNQLEVASFGVLNTSVAQFRFFYNFVRPHQHLLGRTPAEAWAGVDPYATPVKHEEWFEAWDGLLCGLHVRR